MNEESAAASTAAAVPGLLTGRVRPDRDRACFGAPLRQPILRIFLAALAGALAVTCISAILVLSSSVPTERQRAAQDGRQVLSYLWNDCGNRCTVQVISRTAPGTWRVRLQTPRWRRCFMITPSDYAFVPGHGLVGLSATACPE